MVKAPTKPVVHEEVEEAVAAPKHKEAKAASLPTVGMPVQYFTRDPIRQYHGSEGPYAAIVTRVIVPPEEIKDVQSSVSLVVFPQGDVAANSYYMADVLGYTSGEHDHQEWWQYP